MRRGRPLDDGGHILLQLFRLTDDVDHATLGCSVDADEASHHVKQTMADVRELLTVAHQSSPEH